MHQRWAQPTPRATSAAERGVVAVGLPLYLGASLYLLASGRVTLTALLAANAGTSR